MDNDIIQLSASTMVDLSVCKLTAHQIEFLRKIAAKPAFAGLLEPDFTKTRASGPFVCTWLEGTRRHQALIGRYRTLPWPQRGQLAQLQVQMTTKWKPKLFAATGMYAFKDRSNDHDELRDSMKTQWQGLLEAWAGKGDLSTEFEFSNHCQRMARDLIILGNLAFAEEFTARADAGIFTVETQQ